MEKIPAGGAVERIGTDGHAVDGVLPLYFRPMHTRGALLPMLTLVVSAIAFGQASGFKVIYTFTGNADGTKPLSGLTLGKGGVLYGTTYSDYLGLGGNGAVFSLTPPSSPGGTWTEDTLLDFNFDDGAAPAGTLAIDASGVLYGTTITGSPVSGGVAFSLTPPATAGGSWTEDVLYSFNVSPVGFRPSSNIVIGLDGYLYGTTYDYPTVYALAPPAIVDAPWTPYALHSFGGYSGDAYNPGEGLKVGKGGVLYGTSEYGGSMKLGYLDSTVVQSTRSIRHHKPEEFGPSRYSTASARAATAYRRYPSSQSTKTECCTARLRKVPLACENGCGVVFSLTPPALQGGSWTESKLYVFQGGNDGCGSIGGVVFGKNGILYGATYSGGTSGDGTLYSLTPPTTPGARWTHTVLHSFSYPDGVNPETSLVLGLDGILYGTAPLGGTGGGTVFAFKP